MNVNEELFCVNAKKNRGSGGVVGGGGREIPVREDPVRE